MNSITAPSGASMPLPIRVMHFSDTHFGIENYGRIDPSTGIHSRLMDFRDTLLRAIGMALKEGVDLAVFAGDAYRGRDPSQTHQREFARCICTLIDAGVPVVMVTGNHDLPGVRGRANAVEIYQTLGIKQVTVLDKPDMVKIDTARGPIQVAGMRYLMKGQVLARDEQRTRTTEEVRQLVEAKYAEYIQILVSRLDGVTPSILVGHFWVRNAHVSGRSAYLNLQEPQVDLSAVNMPGAFDYVAMGHIHRRQDLNRGAQPPVVYSGSPDAIDFGESDEPKGFVLAEVSHGHSEYRFVDVECVRKLLDIEVSAGGTDPTQDVLAALKKAGIDDAIVRLTIHIDSEHLPALQEKEIRQALQPAFYVAGIRRDVRRTSAERSRALSDSLAPRAALELYLNQSGATAERRAELIAAAAPLFEKQERQEVVG